MRILTFTALLTGLGIVILLVTWQGFGTIAAALTALGAGILLLPLIYMPHLIGAAASWGLLFPTGSRPAFGTLLRAVWVGVSVEAMLPAASLGAELAKARLLMRAGLSGRLAAPSVIVDVTVQGCVLAIWALIGLGVLSFGRADATFKWSAALGAALIAISMVAFVSAQRAGLFGLLAKAGTKLLRRPRWRSIVEGAAGLDNTLRSFYAQPGRILMAVAIRSCSRTMLAIELWLAARWMGHPIDVTDAGMLLGLIGALRAATVVVPGGWGVQEGGYILLGGLVGLPPDVMLALSLVTRAREVIVGIPALVAWQILEGRTLGSQLRRQRR